MNTAFKKSSIYDVCLCGMFIALVLVTTMFINIRLPISVNGGLIHLGNVPLFFAAILSGKKTGALAGAIGMGLFDLLSGWALWAPFTFVIRGVMGYLIGTIAAHRNGKSIVWNVIAIVAGGIWMVFGYYITEVILYGNWVAPFTSVAGNVLQIVLGSVIALPAILLMQKNAPLMNLLQLNDAKK